MCLALFAQTPQKHDPKPYVDSLGMLYWNKNQPFYLRIATSPNDTGRVLESKSHPNYVNPTYFDTEGPNFIRTRFAVDQQTRKAIVPEQEILWELQADGLPPRIKIEFSGAEKYKKGDAVFYGKGLMASVTAKDRLSGVEELFYSEGTQGFQKYNGDIAFQTEGPQQLTTYAVDKVGNVSDPKQERFTVDHTPPKTYSEVEGETQGVIIAAKAKIKLNSEDEFSGVKNIFYKINDNDYKLYNKKVPISKLKDGNYYLTYYATDKVGNKEEERKFEFYLDKLPPILASDVLGDRFIVNDQIYFSGRTKLKLTAVDNKSGVKAVYFSIDGKNFNDYTQPFYLPSVPGMHVIRYYAVDKMNNRTGGFERSNPHTFREYRHNVSKIYVDLTGPSLSYSFIGDVFRARDTVFINTSTKIKLRATDKESGLQYKSYSVNGVQAETRYTGPFTLDKEGENFVEIFGYDNVNNRNRDDFLVLVDDSGPQIIGTFSILPLHQKDGVDVYPKHTILYLAATDNIIGTQRIAYSLNGSPVRTYKGHVAGFKRKQMNKIKVFAVDKLKNKSEKEIMFWLE